VGVPSDDGDDAVEDPVLEGLGVVAPEEGARPVDAGAATEKLEPVTTVTCAPSAVGPWPIVTVPDNECITCSAAAWAPGEE